MKKWNQKMVKAAACLLAFLCILQYATTVISDRSSSTLPALYEERSDSVDVLFVGSSHVYRGVNTPYLWQNYGIAGFNAAGGAQPLWASYYYVKDACQFQSPKVVAVDVLSATGYWKDDFAENATGSVNLFRKNIQHIRNPRYKSALIEEFVPDNKKLSHYVDLIQYRENFMNLNKNSFLYSASEMYQKGFLVVTGQKPPKKITDVSNITDSKGLTPKNREYLDKLIALSKEEGFSLVLINAPYVLDAFHTPPEEQRRYLNMIEQIAGENGIPFLDFTKPEYDCGIDWNTDTYDMGYHVNVYGAEKYTDALGRYLTEHYDLPDRRGDEAYASWDLDYLRYLRAKKAAELPLEKSTAAYFEMVSDSDYLLVLASRGKGIGAPAETLRRELLQMGLTPPQNVGDSFLAVVDNGAPVYQNTGAGLLEYTSEHEGMRIHVKSVGNHAESEDGSRPPAAASIFLDGEEYSKNKDGVNMVVYDKVLKRVVDKRYIAPNKDDTIAV